MSKPLSQDEYNGDLLNEVAKRGLPCLALHGYDWLYTVQGLVDSWTIPRPFAEFEIYTCTPWHQFPHQGQVLSYVEKLFRKTGKINFVKGGRPHNGIWIQRYIDSQRKKKIRVYGFTGGRVN